MASLMAWSDTVDLLPGKHCLSSSMNHGRLVQFLLYGKSHIIPIHKEGKEKKDPNSYCPISLMSCLGKLLQWVINRRLISFLEEQKMLSNTDWISEAQKISWTLLPRRQRMPFKERKRLFWFSLTCLKLLTKSGVNVSFWWFLGGACAFLEVEECTDGFDASYMTDPQ